MRAAQKEESVKRVVVTSSFAAVLDFGKMGPDTTFTHEDWNPVTYEEAKNMDASKQQAQIYCVRSSLPHTLLRSPADPDIPRVGLQNGS